MKNTIGTFEAKTNFGKLIQKVSNGEEILITKRGEPVAKIVPLNKNAGTEAALAAVTRMKLLAQQMRLGEFDWEEWKVYRNAGRK